MADRPSGQGESLEVAGVAPPSVVAGSADRTAIPDVPAHLAAEIEKRFTYYSPQGGQPEKYVRIRAEAKQLALTIAELCPDSRELQRSLTALDDVVFNANAAIARREPRE